MIKSSELVGSGLRPLDWPDAVVSLLVDEVLVVQYRFVPGKSEEINDNRQPSLEKTIKRRQESIQLISYKRYLECTINLSLRVQVAVSTFFMKSPVAAPKYQKSFIFILTSWLFSIISSIASAWRVHSLFSSYLNLSFLNNKSNVVCTVAAVLESVIILKVENKMQHQMTVYLKQAVPLVEERVKWPFIWNKLSL